MYKIAKPFFIIVETPLHAGSGQDLGIVDMPIQRERHTDFPKIEGSGLKGSIREVFEELREIKGDQWNSESIRERLEKEFSTINDAWEINRTVKTKKIDAKDYELTKFEQAISLVFGPEEGDAHAGALGFTDARLLLFPVKSMKGVFAWITCPKILDRLKLDLNLAGIEYGKKMPEEKTAPKDCGLFLKDDKIVLEEYTFAIGKDKDGNCSLFTKWLAEHVLPEGNEYDYQREKIKKDVVVLSDDDFRDFVNLSTEVITRTKIDNETGTVKSGALFTEEYLPGETIMYSLALATPIFNKDKGIFDGRGKEEESVMEFFTQGIPDIIQIGGNATIGKGIVQIVIWEDQK